MTKKNRYRKNPTVRQSEQLSFHLHSSYFHVVIINLPSNQNYQHTTLSTKIRKEITRLTTLVTRYTVILLYIPHCVASTRYFPLQMSSCRHVPSTHTHSYTCCHTQQHCVSLIYALASKYSFSSYNQLGT